MNECKPLAGGGDGALGVNTLSTAGGRVVNLVGCCALNPVFNTPALNASNYNMRHCFHVLHGGKGGSLVPPHTR